MYDETEAQLSPYALTAVKSDAAHHAQSLGHTQTDAGHLLLGIMSIDTRTKQASPVTKFLNNAFGITLAEVRQAVENIDHTTPRPKSASEVKSVLKRAIKFAKRDKKAGHLKVLVITRFHIAEALAAVAGPMFLQVLGELGISRAQFLNAVEGKKVLLAPTK